MDQRELVIADVKTLDVFTFVDAESDGRKELQRAREYLANQANALEKLIAGCPRPDFRKQWADALDRTRRADYQIMPWKEFYAAEREKILANPVQRITEALYREALETLPPLRYEHFADGWERFCLREFYTGSYTQQYFHSKEGWFCRMVDFFDPSTWITLDEVRMAA